MNSWRHCHFIGSGVWNEVSSSLHFQPLQSSLSSKLQRVVFLPSFGKLSQKNFMSFVTLLQKHFSSVLYCSVLKENQQQQCTWCHDFLVCMWENTNACDVLGCVREDTNVLHQHDGTLMHICVGRHQRGAWSSYDPLYFQPSQNLLCVALFPKLLPPNPFAIMIPSSKHLWSSKT